ERQGRVALRLWNREQDLARDRNDEGHDHHREEYAGGEQPDAVDRSGEQRNPPEDVAHGTAKRAHDGNEDEDPDQAVDDARNGDQQFDEEGRRVGDARRQQLGETHRGADAEGDGDGERDQRRDQRAVDERQRAEVELDRVPDARPEKAPAEGGARLRRLRPQLDADGGGDDEDREREGECRAAEGDIGNRGGRAAVG